MARLDGSWLCKLKGYPDVSTDDLTLDELDLAERATGIPYVYMDPHASARVAKALFAVILLRAKLDAGEPRAEAEAAATKAAGKLTMANLHGAFTYVPPPPATQPAAAVGEPAGPPS